MPEFVELTYYNSLRTTNLCVYTRLIENTYGISIVQQT